MPLKKIPCDFYPYSGTGTATIGIRDALEEYLKRAGQETEREYLSDDQKEIKEYLDRYPQIRMVKVRMKGAPDGTKKCKLKGHYFEAYLAKEIAQKGIYNGETIVVLYLKPINNK